MNAPGTFYRSQVMHRRLIAPLYRFHYRLFYLLLDVDRLDELHQRLRLFSRNRFNLVSFYDRDHGDQTSANLRDWAETLLARKGISIEGGCIRLLCLPRILGYAFNPISLWYCEHRDGSLRAVIAAVRNTFGERHHYLLDNDGAPMDWNAAYDKDKCFHVSPFLDGVGQYRFRLAPLGNTFRVHIHETRQDQPILEATLHGQREPLSDRRLLRSVLAMPWMTLKVVVGIHWEALKLWLRGASFHRKPLPPKTEWS